MSKEMLESHMYCRCCLSNESLGSLRETIVVNMKTCVDTIELSIVSSIVESIKDCFSIELTEDENLSNMICEPCTERLKEAHAFKVQIETMQAVLCRKAESMQSLLIEIKKEEDDYEIMKESIEYLEDDFDYLSETERTETESKSKGAKRKPQKTSPKKVTAKRRAARRRSRRNLPYKLDADNLTCPVCKETFPLMRTLAIHMNVHFPNYLCKVCGRGFVTKERLDRHLVSHDVGKYPCKVCHKTFRNKNILGVHSKVHKANNMPFRCPECKDRFVNYYMRQKHLINVHGIDRRLYKCKLCPMSFILSGKLLKHTRSVHLQVRDYVCQECGKAFYTNICLVRHMVKHTGAKDFKCSVCGNEYGRKSTLREHMRIHNNDKRFACSICAKAFTQKCTLKSHMRMHEKKGCVE